MSWGRIVHKAVEFVSRGNGKLKILAGNWIKEEGRDIEDLERLIALIENFKESGLWKRINSAKQKYFEVPFALQEDGSIVYGVIDAVFKEDGGWVIVDYKTDDFENDPERKRAYQKQVDLYGRYWEKISGEKVKERVLVKL
jgi:ATP-dependent helicase/nuclease subunit A